MGGGGNWDVNYSSLNDSFSIDRLNKYNSNDDAVIALQESIIIDDSNYDTYFDRSGYISSDIEDNSVIYFGNISNKYIKVDLPLTLSSLDDTTIFNSTIEILADGTTLRNLNFYTNASSENSDYFSPIYIDNANDLIIENNFIYIDYYDGCNYNLAGIYAVGASSNNIIRNNRISIYSKSNSSSKHYIYGIDFTSYSNGAYSKENAVGNLISSNTIDILSDYYANAITLSCAKDCEVSSNDLILKANDFVYGIVAEYFNSGNGLEVSNNFTFSRNTIEASSSMVYAIQFFDVYNVNISENSIKTYSNGTYGISGYASSSHIIENNEIIINGNDISLVGTNFDSLGSGHSGIYYRENSHDILIQNNNILSNYTLGGDYAIRFDSSSTNNITVIYNNISSNKLTLNGDNSVSSEDSVIVHDNNPYNKTDSNAVEYTIFDIYVDTSGNDNSGNGSYDNPFLTIYKALSYLKALDNEYSNSHTKVKGIIHIGEGVYTGYGSNLRLYITGLTVDLVGSGYNKTVIDGASSHWFFEISEDSLVSIRNISFTGGVYRQNNVGLVYNKGNLYMENCIFTNSKVPKDSAIIYNDGILKLKNNYLGNGTNGHVIHNNGFIDGLYLNLIKDSLNENERVLKTNTNKFNLTAYVHDDNGNPVNGGFVKFFIESKEILLTGNLIDGFASITTYSSLNGIIKISGVYSNAFTNIHVGIGKINNSLISDSIVLYVNNSKDSFGNGTLENPFNSINAAFNEIYGSLEPVTIILLENCSEDINSSNIYSKNSITIKGSNKYISISTNWFLDTNSSIILENLIFDGNYLVKFNSDLTIDNCIFTNSPTRAIYSVNGSLTISNSNFTYNNIKNDHSVEFETRDFEYPIIPPWDCSRYSNRWDYEKGGAIYNILSNLTIINCNFTNNEAFYGGAIFNDQSDLHISDSSFLNNLALNGFTEDSYSYSMGGAILQYLGKEVIITDSLFINNAADAFGGAFYSLGTTTNNIDRIYIDRNIQGYEGVAIKRGDSYLNSLDEPVDFIISPQDIYFINCTFDSNLAPRGGGAVYILNNSMTNYISCNFSNNMVYSYDLYQMFGGWAGVYGNNYLYLDMLENVYTIFLESVNKGGAIQDDNLRIIDSTFSANTVESGGAVIMPTILTYSVERNNLSKSNVGITVENSVSTADSLYVPDSSLLTAEDSAYLGINGWVGTSNGSSISRLIRENSNSGNSGDGSGSSGSGSGSGYGNGSGDGSGLGNGGSLSWGDILSALGGNSNNIAVSGNGSSLYDILNNYFNGNQNDNNSSNEDNANSSANSNSTKTSSDNSIEVEGTSDIVIEDAGGSKNNGKSPSNVGTSSNPLNGEASDSNSDSSSADSSSSSSPGQSGAESSSSGSKAYIIHKNETDNIVADKNMDELWVIILLFFGLLIIGYYKESREDKDKK